MVNGYTSGVTPKEIIKQGTARSSALKPEDCVFGMDNGPSLERWAKDNEVLWRTGEKVTASDIEARAPKGTFCVIAMQPDGKLGFCGTFSKGGGRELSLDDALEVVKVMRERIIILDLQATQPPKVLPSMEF